MKVRGSLLFFAAIALIGCSSDDGGSSPEQNQANYFPLAVDNSWNYNNQREVDGQPTTQSMENFSVVDSTEKNNITYYDLESDNPSEGGLATGLFSNGELSKSNGKLLFNGSFKLYVGQMGIDTLEFPIENAVVFSTTASNGTALSSFSDTFTQEIPVQGTMIPVIIEYTATSTSLGVLDSRVVSGQEFKDILSSDLVVKLAAKASIPIPPFSSIDVPILTEQEVMTATNYYANHVGMIESDVSISYEFEDLTDFGFPNIPPVDSKSSQKLESYSVNE